MLRGRQGCSMEAGMLVENEDAGDCLSRLPGPARCPPLPPVPGSRDCVYPYGSMITHSIP